MLRSHLRLSPRDAQEQPRELGGDALLSRLIVASTLLFAACDTALLGCEDGDLALSTDLAARLGPPSACASDADCVLETPDARCPAGGAQYSWCPQALHREDVAAFEATLGETLAAVCPRIPADCRGGASCAAVVPRCVDARCAAVEQTAACVERCSECLTADSCRGHCGAHLACILEAGSCDHVRACAAGPSAPDAG